MRKRGRQPNRRQIASIIADLTIDAATFQNEKFNLDGRKTLGLGKAKKKLARRYGVSMRTIERIRTDWLSVFERLRARLKWEQQNPNAEWPLPARADEIIGVEELCAGISARITQKQNKEWREKVKTAKEGKMKIDADRANALKEKLN